MQTMHDKVLVLHFRAIFLLSSIAAMAPSASQSYIQPSAGGYNYEYGVTDGFTNTAFAKTEARDELGRVEGSYKLNLPDGRLQIVTYVADERGYRAEVTYEGEPVHPPPSHLLGHHHAQFHQPFPHGYGLVGNTQSQREQFPPSMSYRRVLTRLK